MPSSKSRLHVCIFKNYFTWVLVTLSNSAFPSIIMRSPALCAVFKRGNTSSTIIVCSTHIGVIRVPSGISNYFGGHIGWWLLLTAITNTLISDANYIYLHQLIDNSKTLEKQATYCVFLMHFLWGARQCLQDFPLPLLFEWIRSLLYNLEFSCKIAFLSQYKMWSKKV